MGSGFQVDIGAMDQLINTLQDAAQSITDADNALKNASAQDLGSHELDSAGGDFQDRWTYGTGKISDLAGQIVQNLQTTVTAYQDCDTQVGKMFGGSGPDDGSGSGTGDGSGSGSGTTMRGKQFVPVQSNGPAHLSHIAELLTGASAGGTN